MAVVQSGSYGESISSPVFGQELGVAPTTFIADDEAGWAVLTGIRVLLNPGKEHLLYSITEQGKPGCPGQIGLRGAEHLATAPPIGSCPSLSKSAAEREHLYESVGKSLPVGRVGECHDIAQACPFLMQENSAQGRQS